ncbi:MAG: formate/nitrite transporter family protein [Candidatus Omnitrophica bacterium]|nr:formate/nitrite transporter family protein [Candidatus Omnitrophota bacterium]MBU1853590.1 formate/nitrite transporter family protein [Candidatus Omnitrophota bacterium]
MDNLFLTPLEISQTLSDIGEKKASATIFELLIFGILAGIYIAFGANVAIAVLSGGTLDAGLARFLAGSVFSVGLMLVLIPGSELFTGNILMTIGFIYRKYSFLKVMRNWLIVYFGNLIGAMIIAWLVFSSGLLISNGSLTAMGTVATNIAEGKLDMGFTEALCRGILCNMLVCLAVIMSIASRTVTGKIFGIYFPIMAFVASGYEHSVANMYFLPAGLMVKGEFISGFSTMFNNLIPVTIGNIIGGLLIVLLHPKVEEKIARILVGKHHKQH